jgi:hypothetical protein
LARRHRCHRVHVVDCGFGKRDADGDRSFASRRPAGDGGYGHSRMRETIFGGFTRSVLESADIAVLLMH